jgi:hypothetical protein
MLRKNGKGKRRKNDVTECRYCINLLPLGTCEVNTKPDKWGCCKQFVNGYIDRILRGK